MDSPRPPDNADGRPRAVFVPGYKGTNILKDPDNFLYVKSRTSDAKSFYKCQKFRAPLKCPGTAATIKDHVADMEFFVR